MYLFEYQKKRHQKRRLLLGLLVAGFIIAGFGGKIIYDRIMYEEDRLVSYFPVSTEVYLHGRLFGSIYENVQAFLELHPKLVQNSQEAGWLPAEYDLLLADANAFSVGFWHNSDGDEFIRMVIECADVECVEKKQTLLSLAGFIVHKENMVVIGDTRATAIDTELDSLALVFSREYIPKSNAWYVYLNKDGFAWFKKDFETPLTSIIAEILENQSYPLVLSGTVHQDTLMVYSHPVVLSQTDLHPDNLYRFDHKAPFLRIKNIALTDALLAQIQRYSAEISPDTALVPGFFTRLSIETELLADTAIDAFVIPDSSLLVAGIRGVQEYDYVARQLASYDLPDKKLVDLGDGDSVYEYIAQDHENISVTGSFDDTLGYKRVIQDTTTWNMTFGLVEDMLVFVSNELFWSATPYQSVDDSVDVLCRSGEKAYFSRFLPEQAKTYGVSIFGITTYDKDVLVCLR